MISSKSLFSIEERLKSTLGMAGSFLSSKEAILKLVEVCISTVYCLISQKQIGFALNLKLGPCIKEINES